MTEQNEPKFKVGDTLVIRAKVNEITNYDTNSIVRLDGGELVGYRKTRNQFAVFLNSPVIQQAEVIPAPYRPKVGEKFTFADVGRDIVSTALYSDDEGMLYKDSHGHRSYQKWEYWEQSTTLFNLKPCHNI